MADRERILITVRTYPTISSQYIETVCTGGITDGGEWRRLYPVPLRYVDKAQQYRTFDVVEVDVKPGNDGRLESRRPHMPSLKITRHLDTWQARCDWVNPTICNSLAAVQSANRTLAPVTVREVLEFIATPTDKDWTPKQKTKLQQEQMFDERHPLEKVPFDFRFKWRDGDGMAHDSLVLAWEFGETWRKYRKRYTNPIMAMRDKWLNDLCGPGRQVSFFMGNLNKRRHIYVVCGVFGPPKKAAQNETLW